MSTKAIIAALVGGVLMYLWSTAAHMSPLARTGFQQLSGEAAAAKALDASTGGKAGLYMYPWFGDDMSAKAMKADEQKLATQSRALVIYHPAQPGMKMLSPTQLVGELLLEFFETFVAVWLLTRTGLSTFAGRLGFMSGVGVLAAVVTNASYFIWYGYPGDYTAVAMLMEFGKFFFAGLGAAFILGRTPKTS